MEEIRTTTIKDILITIGIEMIESNLQSGISFRIQDIMTNLVATCGDTAQRSDYADAQQNLLGYISNKNTPQEEA